MEAQPKRCRRCLLQDMADENDYYASVVRYRATMPPRVRRVLQRIGNRCRARSNGERRGASL